MLMKKQILSMFLSIALLLGLIQTLAPIASADAYPADTVIIALDNDGIPTESEGPGWTYDKSLTLNAGYSFAVDGECKVDVTNNGTILGGTYSKIVRNSGIIQGGVYYGIVSNFKGNCINGGLFYGELIEGLGCKLTINNAEFPIEYILNDGIWADGYAAPQTYSYKDGAILPAASDISAPSASFDGWYDNADFEGSPLTNILPGMKGKIVLYASFVSGIATWEQAGEQAQNGADYRMDPTGNYTVFTAKGLAKIANIINKGDSFEGKTITLANDVDLLDGGVYQYAESTVVGRNSWIPISGFAGVFDGGGHKISHLYIQAKDKAEKLRSISCPMQDFA